MEEGAGLQVLETGALLTEGFLNATGAEVKHEAGGGADPRAVAPIPTVVFGVFEGVKDELEETPWTLKSSHPRCPGAAACENSQKCTGLRSEAL